MMLLLIIIIITQTAKKRAKNIGQIIIVIMTPCQSRHRYGHPSSFFVTSPLWQWLDDEMSLSAFCILHLFPFEQLHEEEDIDGDHHHLENDAIWREPWYMILWAITHSTRLLFCDNFWYELDDLRSTHSSRTPRHVLRICMKIHSTQRILP